MAYLDSLYKSAFRRLQRETDAEKRSEQLDMFATSMTEIKAMGHRHGCGLEEEEKRFLTDMDVPLLNMLRSRIARSGVETEGIYLTPDSEWVRYYIRHIENIYPMTQNRCEGDPVVYSKRTEPPEEYRHDYDS